MSEQAALNEAARATWAAGDYDAIAELIWEVGERLAGRLDLQVGEDVLDVACGTGNASVPAARAGARVVGLDLTPELFAAARRRAAAAGVEVDWVAGDAEALPFEDGSFDVVVSTFGVMFAPRHERAARELVRVLRPGGRLGVCSWTPEGNVGEFFRIMAAHLPPPPGPPPTLWGAEDHLRDLLGGTGVELQSERQRVVLHFDSVEAAVTMYEAKFGPVVKARELLEPDGRWPAMRDELAAMFRRHGAATDGTVAYPGEYLMTIGRLPPDARGSA